MIPTEPALLEPRDAAAFLRDAQICVPAFVPGWRPRPGGSSQAVLEVYARFLRSLAERINQAPGKNRLAFFDTMGIELLPAQGARAPVVFTAVAAVGDSRIPERTRVGAKVEGRDEPLVFETEEAIALAAAALVQVVSLWPGRDAYSDHTTAFGAGTPVRLFDARTPVPHEWYLAHDSVLALAGGSEVEVKVELAEASPRVMEIAWEYWDGIVWRGFMIPSSGDGTRGLTRSGTVVLRTECGSSETTSVGGATARWIRARLVEPLPPDPNARLAQVARVRLSSVVDRSILGSACATGRGIVPNNAYADEQKLDCSKSIRPLGARPEPGSAFYLAFDEAMTKPGAEVTLCFRKVTTPEELTDQQTADLEMNFETAQGLVVAAAKEAARALGDAAQGMRGLAVWHPNDPLLAELDQRIADLATRRDELDTTGIVGIAALDDAGDQLLQTLANVSSRIGLEFPGGLLWDLLGAPDLGVFSSGDLFGSFSAFRDVNQQRIVDAGAEAQQGADNARGMLDNLEELTPFSAAMTAGLVPVMDAPVVAWEFWNGRRWQTLTVAGTPEAMTFQAHGPVTFTVPDDASAVSHAGQSARWIRARLVRGGYGVARVVSWKDEASGKLNFYTILDVRPPTLDLVRLGYRWRSRPADPERCVTYNDFRFTDQIDALRNTGGAFEPFHPVSDSTPALYLGFDRPLPVDRVGLYLGVEEALDDEEAPSLVWEQWNGIAWAELRARDETRGLLVPGIVSAPLPGPAFGADPLLNRFGERRAWIRARMKHDQSPRQPLVDAIKINAVRVAQEETFVNDVVGSSNGEPEQVFFARRAPVLAGERLEVRELAGPRARVEEPMLRAELASQALTEDDVRVVRDARTGHPIEIWVRWRSRPNLFFAGPSAREYLVERSRGRILFGGAGRGLAPPAGTDNVVLRAYRSGGGVAGNVPRGGINQVLAGVLAQGVINPRAAEGGADGETLDRVRRRGSATVRHRRQPVSAADYEALAVEASPAIAFARVLPETHPSGRHATGWVTVLAVPYGDEDEPRPSFELRDRVRQFLARRAPATAAHRVSVVAPTYFLVDVDAVLSPVDPAAAGQVIAAARSAVRRFLHPVTGGPRSEGWAFGRGLYLSDVAALLEAMPGVDYVQSLALLVGGSPVGEHVAVPRDRIIAAGGVQIGLAGGRD